MEHAFQQQKILIVDDSDINRSILADMLGSGFEILEAEDGRQAVAMLQAHGPELSLVLLDIVMPNMDGFQVLQLMNDSGWIQEIPVIMISAETVPSYVERAYDLGVTDYISRPFDARIVRRRALNTIMLYAKQKRLTAMVTDQVLEKEKSNDLMIEILSHIVEFRNGESGLHVLHIRTLTELLLRQLLKKTDRYHITHGSISLISNASALHDIGKIAIPESILNKPGRLTPEEFEVMKTHSAEGAAMLERLPLRQHEALVRVAYEICRWHHERYDGRGYPDGLVGDDIPISAQIVSLADVYDALTSKRVYKEAYSHAQAMEMILRGECGAFNPLLVECLTELADRLPEELDEQLGSRYLHAELRTATEELVSMDEPIASDRTLRLLEHERTKYQFFASMSREIQFEITEVPNMLTLSQWGAELLGLPQIVLTPALSKELFQVLDQQDFAAMCDMIHRTTPENPVAEYCCPVTVEGQSRWSKFVMRSMWSGGEPSEYMGTIGKLVDVHEEHSRIQELEELAACDALTGLLNHVNVRKRVEPLLTARTGQHYVLAILDLDFFKAANDLHGHLFGDGVLKYVADKLRRSVRSTDLAARVGGDEFLIFMACSNHPEAQIQRIFQSLTDQYETFRLSVSMGVAQTTDDGAEGYEELFLRADRALYSAKRAGRNQFRFYAPSMEEQGPAFSPIDSDFNRPTC